MGRGGDQLVGAGLFLFAFSVFAYYTVWVLVLPFVDADHLIQAYFPDRYWAIAVPTILIVVGVTFVTTFVGMVLSKKKKAKKSS